MLFLPRLKGEGGREGEVRRTHIVIRLKGTKKSWCLSLLAYKIIIQYRPPIPQPSVIHHKPTICLSSSISK